MDKDFSKRLSRKEFKQGVVAFGMTELSEKDLELLFQCFDKDENDTIDFDEFFRRLRASSVYHEVTYLDQYAIMCCISQSNH
jgi:Ca2+-binding EF-hand superfamily protein